MKEIEWYFPRTLEEVIPLLKGDGIIPHGGGTGILRTRLNRIKGLIDLSHLPLHFFQHSHDTVKIGATQTFAEVIEQLDQTYILTKALSLSASTPLRHRITIGGSVALFPAWSDLMGPLIALEAEVTLVGKLKGTFPIAQYVTDSKLRRGTLITGIEFRNDSWISYYHHEARTHFDYPAFTITILLKKTHNKIEDIRIGIVGCVGKFKRLSNLEDAFKGRGVDEVEVPTGMDVAFTAKKFMSPEYLKHLAGVYVKKGLQTVLMD